MMLKHVLFLLFVCGIKNGGSSTSQEQTIESKDISKNGIKKNEVGANGLENNFEKITRNFQNPVLAYLLQKNSDRTNGQLPPQKGVVREIRHSQTLLMPNFHGNPLPEFLINQLPQFQAIKAPGEQGNRNPESSPFENFWNFLKNKTWPEENKIQESVVFSPVLHLNKSPDEVKEESTSVQTYPAVAVVINTFNKDGSLKNSVTHFQPDFKSLRHETNEKEATHEADGKSTDKNYKNIYNSQYTVNNFIKGSPNSFPGGFDQQQVHRQGISWPFANYFPIVINDPFLSVYYALTASMYNAVSSMIEYGPEADICLKEKEHRVESNLPRSEKVNCEVANRDQQQSRLNNKEIPVSLNCNEKEAADDKANTFDEVTMQSESFRNNYRQLSTKVKQNSKSSNSFGRERRDTTSVFVKSREGDRVDVTLEEPTGSNDVAVNSPDERARSFSQFLINTPPLSTILRPPQQGSRQFLGYADKKRKAKPSKPIKEGSSEEVGEEHEEETTNQPQENGNEAVAISPPPEGASVAEAKPIGLAIAGPGGVAASKPQGTAVAGPGGLAIARPVGTAIAGVDVEGSVPIGGQQKNKKKPKQEQEQTDSELHYVGGLTGPIGNPQPKEFADSIRYKSVKEAEGNNIQDNLFFRGRPNRNIFQIKLGQQNGKYGFIPMFANPVEGESRLQERVDFPIFFHGLLGNNAQGYDHFQNYQTQF